VIKQADLNGPFQKRQGQCKSIGSGLVRLQQEVESWLKPGFDEEDVRRWILGAMTDPDAKGTPCCGESITSQWHTLRAAYLEQNTRWLQDLCESSWEDGLAWQCLITGGGTSDVQLKEIILSTT
jgi:hypothetical protein